MSVNWKEVIHIAIAGVIGGELSLVYSFTVGTPPVIVPWPVGILAYAFFGLVAGLFGVYLLAKTDTSQVMHCLMFAVACGFSWVPILDATSALVQRNHETRLNARVEVKAEEVRALAARLSSVPADQLVSTADLAVRNVESLLAAAAETRDRRLALSVNSSVKKVTESFEEVAKKDPKLALGALRNILNAQIQAGFHQPTSPLSGGGGFLAEELKKKREGG